MIRLARLAALAAAFAVFPVIAAGAAEAPLGHDIEARLDPQNRLLEVTDAITVSGRDTLLFRLAPWIEIVDLRLDGQPAPATPAGGLWRVVLPDTGRHRLDLRLRGTVPALQKDAPRGAIPTAVADGEGSYLSGYSGWVPVTADDWVSWRLAVEIPAPQRVVATGRIESETTGEALNRAVFAADYPAELPALFAGPYTLRETEAGGIRLRSWFHEDLGPLSDTYLDAAGGYLARYAEQIGPYPFPDFHIVSSPLPVGLGFPTLTYVGRMVLPLPFMRGRSLAHEVLHSWWGNGVAVDYGTGNWAEGLTTYMADYALAEDGGADKALEMRLGWLRNYAALPAGRDIAASAFTAKSHDAAQVVGYDKVAFVFHMLRRELGDEPFAAGLRRFWSQQRFRIAGWPALRAAFEEVSGRDLAWFFEQWLARPGAPRLTLGQTAVQPDDSRFRLSLTIRQQAPAYRLSVPVAVETAAGREIRRVRLEGTETTAALTFDARPVAVGVDPDHDLFRRLLPGETPPILRDVTLSGATRTRIATPDEATEGIAQKLAGRLLDAAPHGGSARAPETDAGPLLVVGLAPQVEALLGDLGLGSLPDSLAGRGTARVWTVRQADGTAILIVAADDADALEALLRPLPHYGGKSWLVFEGRRAVDTGLWPVPDSPLARRLDR